MPGRVPELLTVLARREELLSRLEGEPVDKCDLVSELDVSRSTVDRGIRELTERRLIERTGGGHRLTFRGRLVLAEYERFASRVSAVESAGELVDELPADCALAAVALDGADIVTAERSTPHRPVEHHLGHVREAESIRLLATALTARNVEVYYEAVRDGMAVDLLATPTVLEGLVSDYRDRLSAAIETDIVEIRECADPPVFDLFLLELPGTTRLGVMVYVREGVIGYVDNPTDEAVAWGEAFFERHWAAADPISLPVG